MTTTTDRDQLREDVQQAINDCRDADNEPMAELLHRVSVALATPTALDPATIEHCAQIAETLPTDWRDGTQPGPLSAYRHAMREIAAAIRASVEKQ